MQMKIKKLAAMIVLSTLTTMAVFYCGTAVSASKEQGSTNGPPFKSIQERIDLLELDLADALAHLQDQIDALVAEQADQDTLIAALQSAVATLEDRVTDNETDIATLQAIQNLQTQLIDALDVRVTDLEARVAANEDDIAALVLADQALQGLIGAIQAQIATIDARITANDGDISTLQSQVASLNAQLTSVQNQLASKQNRVNGICSPGYSIREIYANGNVACEFDNVSAGVGFLSTYRSWDTVNIPSSTFLTRTVTNTRYCTGSNYRAVGGGYYLSSHLGVGNVFRNYPTSNNTGWYVRVRSDSTGSRTLSTYVVCARVQ